MGHGPGHVLACTFLEVGNNSTGGAVKCDPGAEQDGEERGGNTCEDPGKVPGFGCRQEAGSCGQHETELVEKKNSKTKPDESSMPCESQSADGEDDSGDQEREPVVTGRPGPERKPAAGDRTPVLWATSLTEHPEDSQQEPEAGEYDAATVEPQVLPGQNRAVSTHGTGDRTRIDGAVTDRTGLHHGLL